MKVLVISDIHGDVAKIEELKSKVANPDIVLFAGDFAKFNETQTGKPVLESLTKNYENVFAVLGNCDESEFLEEIESADISVQNCLSFFEGLTICGSGGGSKFTGTTPFEREDEELAGDFEILKTALEETQSQDDSNLILIMHNPPKNTKCDVVGDGIHVGSESLRNVIEETKPILVVTGHIHESSAIDKIGDTTVINPGSLAEGKYSLVELEKTNGAFQVKSAELLTL